MLSFAIAVARTALVKLGVLPRWEVAVYELRNNTPQLPAEIRCFRSLGHAVACMDAVPKFPAAIGLIGSIQGYAAVNGQVLTSVTVVGTTLSGPKSGIVWSDHHPAGFKIRTDLCRSGAPEVALG